MQDCACYVHTSGAHAVNRFLVELQRRNVVRAAGLYLAGAWLLLQVVDTVLPMLSLPESVARTVLMVAVAGFVPAMVLAWVFQWTPGGLRREVPAEAGAPVPAAANRRIDHLIMVLLALALGYFAIDKFVLAPQRERAQVAEALQEGRSQGVAQAFGDRSIAVLPFRDMSRAHDQKYFSDGVAEQLLGLLTQVSGLRVISRQSSFSFADSKDDIPTIARKLNVGYVLEGSVQAAGNTVRVSVRLIEGRSDTQVWARTFDRSLDDIFAIQDEIASAVVDSLKIEVLGGVPTTHKTRPEALRLYLQAIEAYRRRSPESLREAMALTERALAIDPGYVDALTLQASIFIDQAGLALIPAEEGFNKAEAIAKRALELDPKSPAAYSKLAYIILSTDGDLARAAELLERALEISPSDPSSLRGAEILSAALGRMDLAEQIQLFQLARDPLMATSHEALCQTYIARSRYDEAIAECRTAIGLEPDRVLSHFRLGLALLFKGEAQEAMKQIDQEPFEVFRWLGQAMAAHSLGDRAGSDAAVAQLVEKYADEAAYNIAYVEAWRGRPDAAFRWLNRAVETRDSGLPMIASDPILTRLRGDPRWLSFLRRVGRAPDQLSSIRFDVRLPEANAP